MIKTTIIKFCLATVILAFYTGLSFGQDVKITPMHKFFQKYGDSTLIIEYPTDSFDPPSYKIVSNVNDTVNCFTYIPLDTTYLQFVKWPTGLPRILGAVLSLQKTSFNTMPADINIFFKMVKMPAEKAKTLWHEVAKNKPWQLLDDKAYPTCPPDKKYAIVMDDPYYILHLITKKEIKTLIYYAPSFYENEACPGNKNRQGILKIYSLFDQYFNKK